MGDDFEDIVNTLNSNSDLKVKPAETNNIQTSMMIDKDAKILFRKNGSGTFSAYVNELILNDMKKQGWKQ